MGYTIDSNVILLTRIPLRRQYLRKLWRLHPVAMEWWTPKLYSLLQNPPWGWVCSPLTPTSSEQAWESEILELAHRRSLRSVAQSLKCLDEFTVSASKLFIRIFFVLPWLRIPILKKEKEITQDSDVIRTISRWIWTFPDLFYTLLAFAKNTEIWSNFTAKPPQIRPWSKIALSILQCLSCQVLLEYLSLLV
jgi:hypothetical protein